MRPRWNWERGLEPRRLAVESPVPEVFCLLRLFASRPAAALARGTTRRWLLSIFVRYRGRLPRATRLLVIARYTLPYAARLQIAVRERVLSGERKIRN